MNDLDWESFEGGSTIGQPGTEGGETIIDLENVKGARVTLEKQNDSHFAITLGIYGLMMHTHFEDSLEKAEAYVIDTQISIDNIIAMYDVATDKRNNDWENKKYKMISDLAEMGD